MLGEYVAEHYPGKKLGLLLQNNEFGEDGEKGVRAGIAGSDVQVVDVEKYESVQWDVTAQTQRLKNAGAEVVLAYAIPPPAASLVKTAREVLNWDVPIVVTGVDATELFVSLAGAKTLRGSSASSSVTPRKRRTCRACASIWPTWRNTPRTRRSATSRCTATSWAN